MKNMFDEQANGWHDDGSESGVIRTALARGNLVLRPLCSADISTVTAGNGVCNPIVDDGSVGSGNQYLFVQASDATSSVHITFQFNGRALGFCFSSTTALGSKNVSAVIDGVAYPFPPVPRMVLDPATSIPGGRHYYPIVDNLSDGVHQCTFVLIGDAISQAILLYGIYIEERVGYRPAPPSSVLANSALVAVNTRLTLNTLFSYNSRFNYISAIHLANVTASDCLVTLDKNNMTFWREIVAANKTREINFPLPVSINYAYGITCQTANAIQASLWGYLL
jgi:hypothetical protein